MAEMETVTEILKFFSQLSDEQKVVAIEMARCLAEGRDEDARRGGR